jgi:hypothetical protein
MRNAESEMADDKQVTPGFPGDLEDWFAGMALSGVIRSISERQVPDGVNPAEVAAAACADIAAAMMTERAKRGKK